MNTINFFFLLLLILVICDDEFPKGKDLVIITDSNYEEIIEKYDYLLILFYGPGCEHCKKFYSEYEKAAHILMKEKLFLSIVDISKEKNLSETFRIKELPTIRLLSKKSIFDYTGGSTKDEIINWMRKKTNGTAVNILKTVEDVEKFQKENSVVLIYFGSDKNDTELFTKEARKNENLSFGIVESKDVINKYAKEGSMLFIKKADELKIELTEINEKNIEEIISKYSLPKIFDFNEKAAQIIFGKSLPSLFLFGNKKLLNRWEDHEKLMKYLSRTVNTTLKLVLANVKDKISKKLFDFIGLEETDIPSIVIIDARDGFKKFKMEGEVNDVNAIQFIKNWESNSLKQYLRTAVEPANNDGPVKIIVGSSYEREVINNDKDVFVIFHFPGCHYCKELFPAFEEVAKKLKDKNPKLLIGTFNVNENEIDLIRNIYEFPSIKFYPGNKKKEEPLEYYGSREVKYIIEYIKQVAYNKIDYEEEKNEEDKKEEKKEKDKKEDKKEENKKEEKKDKTTEL
jgi:protein disulfide-isomerase A1